MQHTRGFRVGEYQSDGTELGRGATAIVYRGAHVSSREPVAIKVISLDIMHRQPKVFESLRKEISILSRANHPNIVRLYHYEFSQTHAYLVLELCDLGEMAHYLSAMPGRCLSEDAARYFMQQLANGLQHIRANEAIHRDLKPQNLLLKRGANDEILLKIADFGYAREVESAFSMISTIAGTPLYMAPEILRGTVSGASDYSASSDLWSVGVIFYEMLFGSVPFSYAKSPRELLDLIESVPRIPFPPGGELRISIACQTLLLRLLEKNTAQRISWSAFFSDPWLQGEAPVIRYSEVQVRATPDLSMLLSATALASYSPPVNDSIKDRNSCSADSFELIDDSDKTDSERMACMITATKAIATFGDQKAEQSNLYEALCLYRRALFSIRDCCQELLRKPGEQTTALADLRAAFDVCMLKFEVVAGHSAEPPVFLDTSLQIIFRYALFLAKSAAMEEMHGNLEESAKLYEPCLGIVYILLLHVKSASDKAILDDYRKRFWQHLQGVRRQLSSVAAPSSSNSGDALHALTSH